MRLRPGRSDLPDTVGTGPPFPDRPTRCPTSPGHVHAV